MASLYLDISTSALPNAADYLDTPRPPSNWKDPAKIAAFIEEKRAERLADAALDLDLCQITGVAWALNGDVAAHVTHGTDDQERTLIACIAQFVKDGHELVTFNGRSFDVPVLKRRAKYLGIWFPAISTDRFKSPVIDLLSTLSEHDPQRRRSLSFYCRRLGWTDLIDKPLDGREESQVLVSGDWEGLRASLRRDVLAIQRLAEWTL